MELISLSDGDNGFRARVLGRRSPLRTVPTPSPTHHEHHTTNAFCGDS